MSLSPSLITPHLQQDFAYSLGQPRWSAGFRHCVDDFRVDEVLGFQPRGQGEHLLLFIAKENQNTRWVAGLLAAYYGVTDSDVGYCGLKDRRAITRQWFSVPVKQSAEKLPLPVMEGCTVLEAVRHETKLRPGMHAANGFVIRLRALGEHRAEVEQRLVRIVEQGVPNYFGEQRFGIARGNLVEVEKILSHARPRFGGRRGGLYLSAARSWLFNLVLSRRVEQGNWRHVVQGEAVLDGPLWGRGRHNGVREVQQLEAAVLQDWRRWCEALEHSGLRQERRALVLRPGALRWQWLGEDLELAFTLPPGSFATALLRELALLQAPAPVMQ